MSGITISTGGSSHRGPSDSDDSVIKIKTKSSSKWEIDRDNIKARREVEITFPNSSTPVKMTITLKSSSHEGLRLLMEKVDQGTIDALSELYKAFSPDHKMATLRYRPGSNRISIREKSGEKFKKVDPESGRISHSTTPLTPEKQKEIHAKTQGLFEAFEEASSKVRSSPRKTASSTSAPKHVRHASKTRTKDSSAPVSSTGKLEIEETSAGPKKSKRKTKAKAVTSDSSASFSSSLSSSSTSAPLPPRPWWHPDRHDRAESHFMDNAFALLRLTALKSENIGRMGTGGGYDTETINYFHKKDYLHNYLDWDGVPIVRGTVQDFAVMQVFDLDALERSFHDKGRPVADRKDLIYQQFMVSLKHPQSPIDQLLREGKPIIIPVCHKDHIYEFVVERSPNGEIHISVIDSLPLSSEDDNEYNKLDALNGLKKALKEKYHISIRDDHVYFAPPMNNYNLCGVHARVNARNLIKYHKKYPGTPLWQFVWGCHLNQPKMQDDRLSVPLGIFPPEYDAMGNRRPPPPALIAEVDQTRRNAIIEYLGPLARDPKTHPYLFDTVFKEWLTLELGGSVSNKPPYGGTLPAARFRKGYPQRVIDTINVLAEESPEFRKYLANYKNDDAWSGIKKHMAHLYPEIAVPW